MIDYSFLGYVVNFTNLGTAKNKETEIHQRLAKINIKSEKITHFDRIF